MINLDELLDTDDGEYLSSPLEESDGEFFEYDFIKDENLATLFIHNPIEKQHWQFFIALGGPLTVSEHVKDKCIFHHEARVYLPVMELLIDILGDSCCIMFLEKHGVSYDYYHLSFVRQDHDPILKRGNFNKQLVRLSLVQ